MNIAIEIVLIIMNVALICVLFRKTIKTAEHDGYLKGFTDGYNKHIDYIQTINANGVRYVFRTDNNEKKALDQ